MNYYKSRTYGLADAIALITAQSVKLQGERMHTGFQHAGRFGGTELVLDRHARIVNYLLAQINESALAFAASHVWHHLAQSHA